MQLVKNCKHKKRLYNRKNKHTETITEKRKITYKEKMFFKMEKEEYKEEYTKRSQVEGPFGPLKIQYNIENEIVIGIKDTEDYMDIKCSSI